jgi:hypothetical protein
LVVRRWKKLWSAVRFCLAAETISLVKWQVGNASLPNNHNAGELLILVFIESRFGHNVSGDCGNHRQPVIA